MRRKRRYTMKERREYARSKLDLAVLGMITHPDLLIKQFYAFAKNEVNTKWPLEGGIHSPRIQLTTPIEISKYKPRGKQWFEEQRRKAKKLNEERKVILNVPTREEIYWKIAYVHEEVKRFAPHIDFRLLFAFDLYFPMLINPLGIPNKFFHYLPLKATLKPFELSVDVNRNRVGLCVSVKTTGSSQTFIFTKKGQLIFPSVLGTTVPKHSGMIVYPHMTRKYPIYGYLPGTVDPTKAPYGYKLLDPYGYKLPGPIST